MIKGHLSCRDTFLGILRYPLKTGSSYGFMLDSVLNETVSWIL